MPSNYVGNPLAEAALGLAIFGIALVIAWAAARLVGPLMSRFASRTKSKLDDYFVWALRLPVIVIILVQGALIALSVTPSLDLWQAQMNQAWVAVDLVLLFWIVQRLLASVLYWWAEESMARNAGSWGSQAAPILRRMLTLTVLSIGALTVLDSLGISISPLLAGLGIGGLAVAFALQPTLSNFVSGTYVLSDGTIRPGDFIELTGGPMGRVIDVGWRTTRLLTPQNNVATVPNSKIADSIVTNFALPDRHMNVFLTCGVSYESDLDHVEQVALEAMLEVRQRCTEAVKDYQPIILFNRFAESNIEFWLVMQAIDRGATFNLTHELVKAVGKRFRAEGIEINYPVRKLVAAGSSPRFISRNPSEHAQ